jgi:hypothetical protein
LPFNSKAIGKLSVPGIEQFKCTKCGNTLVSLNETDKILDFVNRKEQEAINRLPIGDFLSMNEAAGILGVSKQAFNKNPRIKRGFIYFIKKDGRKYYYKKSVEEFKRTGKDGRINLMVAPYEKVKRPNVPPFIHKLPVQKMYYDKIASPRSTVAASNYPLLSSKSREKKYKIC